MMIDMITWTKATITVWFNMQRHLDMLLQGHPLEICLQTWEILAIVQ